MGREKHRAAPAQDGKDGNERYQTVVESDLRHGHPMVGASLTQAPMAA